MVLFLFALFPFSVIVVIIKIINLPITDFKQFEEMINENLYLI